MMITKLKLKSIKKNNMKISKHIEIKENTVKSMDKREENSLEK